MSSTFPLGNDLPEKYGPEGNNLRIAEEYLDKPEQQLSKCSVINTSCYNKSEMRELSELVAITLQQLEFDIVCIQRKQESFDIVYPDPEKTLELQSTKQEEQKEESAEISICKLETCIQEILLSEQGDFVCVLQEARCLIIYFLNIESRKIFEEDFKKKFEKIDLIRAPFKISKKIYQLEKQGDDIGSREVSELNKIALPYGLQVLITKQRNLKLCRINLGKERIPHKRGAETDGKQMKRLYPREDKIEENVPLSKRQEKRKVK